MCKLSGKLTNPYVYALVTKVLGIILGMVYTILLSRYLGPSLRGEFSVMLNYANIIAAIVGFGIYQAYPFYKINLADQKELHLNFARNIVGLFLVYMIICILGTALLPVSSQTKVILLTIPLMYLYKQTNYLVLIENPRECNKGDLFLNIFDIVFVVALMLATEASFFWCAFFLVVERFVYGLFFTEKLKINFFKVIPKIDRNIVQYAKYGFMPMLTILLMTLNNKIDIFMLSWHSNISSADIGIYSVGTLLAEKLWILPDVLTNILQSRLANGQKEEEVAKISRLSFWITAICLIGVVIFGKPFISLAYGSAYENAYSITVVVLFGVLGMVFYKVVYAFNVVKGKKGINLVLLLVSNGINVILNTILIPSCGTMGAGIASLIAFVFCGFAFLITFSVDTKVPIRKMFLIEKNDILMLQSIIKKERSK